MSERAGLDAFSNRERAHGDRPAGAPSANDTSAAALQPKEDAKLRQIVPRFFTKAALTILSARVDLPQSFSADSKYPKANAWFNLSLDETDILLRDLAIWANFDPLSERAPPLIIEVYLDTSELTRNQTLVVMDERGRRWDVCEALAPPTSTGSRAVRKAKSSQVVLERWKLYLGDKNAANRPSGDSMSNAYKKAVVMFRSLFAYLRSLPAWKFGRRVAQEPATLTSLRPTFRILREDPTGQPRDSLCAALYPSADPIFNDYRFQPIYTPAGPMSIDVSYRNNCDFRVDDSEALLSSRFMGMDSHYFRPSLDERAQEMSYLAGGKGVGSLPADKRAFKERQDLNQAYGSMSTFHNIDLPPGTSPISALRAARDMRSDSTPDSPPQKALPTQRASMASRSSLKSADGPPTMPRRVSVSFQPFKAGSLSSSPAANLPPPASPRRESISGIGHTRNKSSLNTLPQTALRTPGGIPEVAVGSPSSSSPKAPPLSRYSSSFGHRRSRLSSGGNSGSGGKGDDDNGSSGRASQVSNNQPGSGLLTEGDGNSSGSARSDDDNISDFLKLLEQKKDLKSFNRMDDASRDATAKRTSAALSRYQRQRESHSVLGDSISSSVALHRSSSSSSRQLPNAPPALAGNSVSSSSSPGKPLSPHTPHTPAIPSRLGTNTTVADYSTRRSRPAQHSDPEDVLPGNTPVAARRPQTAHDASSGAIDIPTSPQRYPHIRRSSSAAHRGRGVIEDEFGMRSASVPLDDRPDLSLSELFAAQNPLPHAHPAEPPSQDSPSNDGDTSRSSAPLESPETSGSMPSHNNPPAGAFRSRFQRGGSSGSHRSSFERGIGQGSLLGRYSFSARRGDTSGSGSGSATQQGVGPTDDDEPLLFTMSELGSQQRRAEGGAS